MKTARLLILLGLFGLPGIAWGQAMPEDGLKAEMEDRWEDAVVIYRELLAQTPERTDLWLRLADILNGLGREGDTARALEAAASASPNDHAIQFRLAQAYAVTHRPGLALAACRRASELQPDNIDYLRDCAHYADWTGDLKATGDAFQRVLARAPDDPGARLGLARTRSWSGELNEAARDFRSYLDRNPDDRGAWLDYARNEIWRGNYPVAQAALETYRERFGENEDYQRWRARVLAAAGRPDQAAALNDPLLARQPDDYDLNYTRALILHANREPRAANESLAVVQRLQPESKETHDLERLVRTPQRSHVSGGLHYYNDSDKIRITGITLHGAIGIAPATQISAGLADDTLRAPAGSGLERIDGGERIGHKQLWLGARHQVNPMLALAGRIGRGAIEDEADYWLYDLRAELVLSDELALAFERERDLFAVSPRTVSLGIKRDSNRAELSWQPGLRYVVDAVVAYDDLSDGNARKELIVAPRRVMVRREHGNLDLGVSGQWFGFDKDLDNGYYDPRHYRRFALTAFGYWKISDDDGVSLSASAGYHKDENMSKYKFGEDLVAEGTFGIFRDWMGKLRLGYSNRAQEAGGFDGVSAQATVTRRF